MLKYQRGASLGTMGVVTVVILFFAYMVMRLFPPYMGHLTVKSIMDSVKKDLEKDISAPTVADIQKGIRRNLEVNDLPVPKIRDFKIKKTKTGYNVSVKYQREQEWMGPVHFLMKFEESIDIRSVNTTG